MLKLDLINAIVTKYPDSDMLCTKSIMEIITRLTPLNNASILIY